MNEVRKWISGKWVILRGTECSLAGRVCMVYRVDEPETDVRVPNARIRTELEKASAFGGV